MATISTGFTGEIDKDTSGFEFLESRGSKVAIGFSGSVGNGVSVGYRNEAGSFVEFTDGAVSDVGDLVVDAVPKDGIVLNVAVAPAADLYVEYLGSAGNNSRA